MIRNPINPYPQNITIDKNKGFLSFKFSGDRLGSYGLSIQEYGSSSGHTVQYVSLEEYKYNNDEIKFYLSDYEGVLELKNGGNYTWQVIMSPNKAFDQYSKDNFTSPKYYFQLGFTPVVNINPEYTFPWKTETEGSPSTFDTLPQGSFKINKEDYVYYADYLPLNIEPNDWEENYSNYYKLNDEGKYINVPSEEGDAPTFVIGTYYEQKNEFDSNGTPIIKVDDITNKQIDILGYYFGDNIKYYYFQLFDEDDNLINETDKIFSSKVEYNYSGLLSNKNYYLYFYSISQNDQKADVAFEIKTKYNETIDNFVPPTLVCDDDEANIKIKWRKDFTSQGLASGEIIYNENKTTATINSGTIVYDNISNSPITMDKNNFAIGLKTEINDNTTKILDYVNNDVLYEIYMENYYFYLSYGEINSSFKVTKQLEPFKASIEFGIQKKSSAETDTGYMMYDGEEYEITGEDREYILISEEKSYNYLILLQNINGDVRCNIERITN